MRIFGKILAGLVGGFLFAFLGLMVVSLAIGGGEGELSWLLWALWAVAIAVVWFSPSAGKAWRRLLISCAVLALMVPLSTAVLSGTIVSDMASSDETGTGALGASIGTGAATLFTGFISFFLSAIFLIVGLLVGRDKAPT